MEIEISSLRTARQLGFSVPFSDCCCKLHGAAVNNNLVSVPWGVVPVGWSVTGLRHLPHHPLLCSLHPTDITNAYYSNGHAVYQSPLKNVIQ